VGRAEGGEARNHEAEVARKAFWAYYREHSLDVDVHDRALEAALDAVRRSPQGEDHEAGIAAYRESLASGHSAEHAVIAAIRASRCPSPEESLVADNAMLAEALRKLCDWAEAARGHYGIEECGGPGQPRTEWDEVQDGLKDAARYARELVSEFRAAPSPERNTESIRVCKHCNSLIGSVRAVVKLRDCPECYEPIVPVEDYTRAVLAEYSSTAKEPGCVLPSAHKGPCRPRPPQGEDRCPHCGSPMSRHAEVRSDGCMLLTGSFVPRRPSPQGEDHEPDADGWIDPRMCWIDPRTCPHPEVRGGFCRRCGLVLEPQGEDHERVSQDHDPGRDD